MVAFNRHRSAADAWGARDDPLLLRWHTPEVQLCRIDRPHEPTIQRYLDLAVESGRLGSGWWLAWHEAEPLPAGLLPVLPGHGVLLRDIEELAALLCSATGSRQARIRFDVVSGVQCPRFHVDNVQARLLCTYRGAGTQWLDDADADRCRLGVGAQGQPDESSGLILRPGAVQSLPAFAIALLKGRRWPGNAARGAIHRSPPVSPSAGPRVLVAIDVP